MAKKQKAYLGLDWIVSLILAIIPITSWILGIVHRFQRGNTVMALVQLIGGLLSVGILVLVFWIIDLVSMIMHKDLKWLV
jgi:uncharacterized membrane protein